VLLAVCSAGLVTCFNLSPHPVLSSSKRAISSPVLRSLDVLQDSVARSSGISSEILKSTSLSQEDMTEIDALVNNFNQRDPDFQANLGKIISTLNADLPYIFVHEPDMSIFTPELELRDPSGVQFSGLAVYKKVFGLARFLRKFAMSHCEAKHKLTYDWMKQQVRVTWNTRIWPQGQLTPVHIDGISIYSVNDKGLIYAHRVEKVIVNGMKAEPPYGIKWLMIMERLKAGVRAQAKQAVPASVPSISSLKMSVNDDGARASSDAVPVNQAKDESREQKKSLKDRIMEFLPKITTPAPPQSCETSWDCDYDESCCDFLFAKICCSGGLKVDNEGFTAELIPVLIPIEEPQFPRYPGQGGVDGGYGGYGRY
jgi:hypothetical protein